MKFGLTDSQFKFVLESVVLPLESRGGRVWCYGSRARADHQPFSDLDLMVESDSNLSKEIFKIQEDLRNSNFPFKVDLVPYSEFADSYKPGYQNDKKPFKP